MQYRSIGWWGGGLLLWMQVAHAQCPTAAQFGANWRNGSFEITGREVGTQCTGRPVRVVTPADIANARYIYNYRTRADTVNAATNTSFVYTQPGPYYIVQIGTRNGQPTMSCNLVQVYATSPPVFRLSNGCGGSVQLTLNTTGQIYSQYVVNWGDGKPAQVYAATQAAIPYAYAAAGTYQVSVLGQGTGALQGCSANSEPQPFEVLPAPAAVTNATATVASERYGQFRINLPNGSNNKNFVFGLPNGREITQIQNVFTDSLADASQGSVCYQVSYTDRCDKTPTTKPTVCTIYLEDKNGVMQWSEASPFVGAVQEYVVEALSSDGQVVQQYNVGRQMQWEINLDQGGAVTAYRVRAVGTNSATSVSNTVAATLGVALFVPDAFSPNGDQTNDLFEMKGRLIEKGEVTIYDRWGNVVFYSNDWRKSWDGNDTKGRLVTPGAYTYRIDYQDTKQQAHQKFGAVYVVR
jgi:gliding motility-associated-like protein